MISVIIPVYNCQQYIAASIDSVLNQTYSEWELIIVDDHSTDETAAIVLGYCKRDFRIRYYSTPTNSGGCRIPRFLGIEKAMGAFVVSIDADDYIEPEYLEKLLSRQEETNADLVLAQMIEVDEVGYPTGTRIPGDRKKLNWEYTGTNAFAETLNGWRLAMAGMLLQTDFIQNYIRSCYPLPPVCNSFEIEWDQRMWLYKAEKVATSSAQYFFRKNPQSVTRNFSEKCLDCMDVDRRLYGFIKTAFPTRADFIQMIEWQCCASYISRLMLMCTNNVGFFQVIRNIKMKEMYNFIKEYKMRARNVRQRFVLMSFVGGVIIGLLSTLKKKWIFR